MFRKRSSKEKFIDDKLADIQRSNLISPCLYCSEVSRTFEGIIQDGITYIRGYRIRSNEISNICAKCPAGQSELSYARR